MTDGRAITGMTADSHARSDIPAFFSPGISIFPDRAARVFEIEHRQVGGHLPQPRPVRMYARVEILVSPKILTSRVRAKIRTMGLLFATGRLRAVQPSLRAFGFSALSALVSLTTAGCPPVPSVFYPSSISVRLILPADSSSFSFFLSVRHRIQYNWEYVSASRSRPRAGYTTVSNFNF